MNKIIISSISLLVLDFCWIGFFMGGQYNRMIPLIQGSKMVMNYYSAALAYLLMIVGLQVFVIPNINPRKLITSSLKYGFLFGIILYGVYDLTAGAVLKKWDFKLAAIDILWGGLVYFLTCIITFKILEAVNKKRRRKDIYLDEQSMNSELYY
jgi:uncharacterized membrane protein